MNLLTQQQNQYSQAFLLSEAAALSPENDIGRIKVGGIQEEG